MQTDNEAAAPDDGETMTEFERLLATASMLETSITIHMRGPRTPRPAGAAPEGPRYVALVQVAEQRKVMGFGETPLEAVENAAAGQVLTGPYAVKS